MTGISRPGRLARRALAALSPYAVRSFSRLILPMVTTLEPPIQAAPTAAPSGARARRGELAMALQEVFTAAVRLRAHRSRVADAGAFRAQIKHLLAAADREGARAGYDRSSLEMATFASIALIDESVLNSGEPALAGWASQSLQEEVFGDHMAGETFFTRLDELLGRQDSEETADVLEVFILCLLLGFRGRYAVADRGSLDARLRAAREKVARVRGPRGALSPAWTLPVDEAVPAARDPWVRRLWLAALALAVLAVVLYVAATLNLSSWVREIARLAGGPG